MIYALHCYDTSIYMSLLKELSVGFHTAEFHPKHKKLKYWQKKRK
jgi:hypothetical protein